MFNQLAGYTPQTNTKYTGFNATVAPTTTTGNTRWIWTKSSATQDSDLGTSDTFTLAAIDDIIGNDRDADARQRRGSNRTVLYLRQAERPEYSAVALRYKKGGETAR